MKKNAVENWLLADVLGEAAPSDFQERLLRQAVRTARRRRHLRQGGIAACIGAMVCGSFLLLFQSPSPGTVTLQPPQPAPAPKFSVVQSEALTVHQVVQTQTIFVSTVSSSEQFVSVVESEPSWRLYRIIGDFELLRLAGGGATALVRHPNGAILVAAGEIDPSSPSDGE